MLVNVNLPVDFAKPSPTYVRDFVKVDPERQTAFTPEGVSLMRPRPGNNNLNLST